MCPRASPRGRLVIAIQTARARHASLTASRRVQAQAHRVRAVPAARVAAVRVVVPAAVMPAIALKAAAIKAAVNAVPAPVTKATINVVRAAHRAARVVRAVIRDKDKVSVHHVRTDIRATRPASRPITPIPARSIRGTNRVRQVRAAPAPEARMQVHDPVATTVLVDRVHPVREVHVPVELVVPAVAIGNPSDHKQTRALRRPFFSS